MTASSGEGVPGVGHPLIQPVLRDAALLADIDAAEVPAGGAAVWWLGQSGYAVKLARARLYFDLYLSEHLTAKYGSSDKPHIRMTAAPLAPGAVNDADLVFASHKHSDHLDPGGIARILAASPRARLILPAAIASYAIEQLGLDPERLIAVRGDETEPLVFADLGVSVLPIPSAHADLEQTAAGEYMFLGFIVRALEDGAKPFTLYHSGDTVVYDGLADRLRAAAPDLAFLPINGSTPKLIAQGVAPNMSGSDAVRLAQDANIGLTIPHHYDMFTFNTVPVSTFTEPADSAGIACRVLRPGERSIVRPAR